jgi:hypothetical protein
MDHDAAKQVVSLPDGYEVAAVIPIGRPAVEPKEGPTRKAVTDMVHLNTFGKKMF